MRLMGASRRLQWDRDRLKYAFLSFRIFSFDGEPFRRGKGNVRGIWEQIIVKRGDEGVEQKICPLEPTPDFDHAKCRMVKFSGDVQR